MNETQALDASKPGLIEKIKNVLSPDNLAQRFHLTKGRLLEMGLYLMIGFVVGYFLKKYSKFFFTLLLIILVLVILQQLNILTIIPNWAKVQEIFGITPPADQLDKNMLAGLWVWIKDNVGLALSFALGLLLGLRLAQ